MFPESERDLLIRMDEKMDAVLKWQEQHMARCHVVHAQHETQIQALQEWRWKQMGALSAVVLLINIVIRFLFP